MAGPSWYGAARGFRAGGRWRRRAYLFFSALLLRARPPADMSSPAPSMVLQALSTAPTPLRRISATNPLAKALRIIALHCSSPSPTVPRRDGSRSARHAAQRASAIIRPPTSRRAATPRRERKKAGAGSEGRPLEGGMFGCTGGAPGHGGAEAPPRRGGAA